VILAVLFGAGFIFLKMNSNEPGQVASQVEATLAPNLSKLLNLNTPVVQYYVPPAGATEYEECPGSAAEAANLFGGLSENWSYPRSSNGWVMMAINQATTIYVPDGMKAAYIQLADSILLIEIPGPASLSNVYYVAISCP
jgi:hypothetical protein